MLKQKSNYIQKHIKSVFIFFSKKNFEKLIKMSYQLTDADYIRYFFITLILIGGLVKFGFLIPIMIENPPDLMIIGIIAACALLIGFFLAHRFYYGAWRNDKDRVSYVLFVPLAFVFHCIPTIVVCLFYYIMNYAVFEEYVDAKDISGAKKQAEQFYCITVFIVSNILSLIGLYKDPLVLICCLQKSSDYIEEQIYNKTMAPNRAEHKPVKPANPSSTKSNDGAEFGAGGMVSNKPKSYHETQQFGQNGMFGITVGPPPPPSGQTKFKETIKEEKKVKISEPERTHNNDDDDFKEPTICTTFAKVYFCFILNSFIECYLDIFMD